MMTILLIEDNVELMENTVEMLELMGYDILCAEDGKKGLDLAKEHLPDLILCDIMMPEMDGYEVIGHLKKDTKTAPIKFIFVSAKFEKKDIALGKELGADGYLSKPFSFDDLSLEIKRCLGK